MLRHAKILVKFVGRKVNLVHGFFGQGYFSKKEYHFLLEFIEKLAWVNETKKFASLFKIRHSS